ncbi:hypothetical protein [Rhodococcus sp. OK302]|nr:hypothetical protein [Rhodococcus sp. OK302]OYD60936.1 hypothetical protein BDB13_5843 [Rhodococcus sp. OK302]
MNANVAELLLVLAAGIGGTAALQAVLRRRGSRRSFRLGAHLMQPHE